MMFLRPTFETRFEGKNIPQFVTLRLDVVTNIYDMLDIHFSKAYDIDVIKLRKEAYENYKKKIFNKVKKSKPKNNDLKPFSFKPVPRIKKNRLVIDFYFEIIDKKPEIKHGKQQNRNIKFENREEPWERYTRIKTSKLLRLKKWIR